jgi:hypothetical protein
MAHSCKSANSTRSLPMSVVCVGRISAAKQNGTTMSKACFVTLHAAALTGRRRMLAQRIRHDLRMSKRVWILARLQSSSPRLRTWTETLLLCSASCFAKKLSTYETTMSVLPRRSSRSDKVQRADVIEPALTRGRCSSSSPSFRSWKCDHRLHIQPQTSSLGGGRFALPSASISATCLLTAEILTSNDVEMPTPLKSLHSHSRSLTCETVRRAFCQIWSGFELTSANERSRHQSKTTTTYLCV